MCPFKDHHLIESDGRDNKSSSDTEDLQLVVGSPATHLLLNTNDYPSCFETTVRSNFSSSQSGPGSSGKRKAIKKRKHRAKFVQSLGDGNQQLLQFFFSKLNVSFTMKPDL